MRTAFESTAKLTETAPHTPARTHARTEKRETMASSKPSSINKCRSLIAELERKATPEHLQSIYRRAAGLKILTCNHCVACCEPTNPRGGRDPEPVSIDYVKRFVHHALPNVRSRSVSAFAAAASSKAARLDHVDFRPSALRERRGLKSLGFVHLPQTYTNIPDFYSELVVVQYEVKKDRWSPTSALSPASCGSGSNTESRQAIGAKRSYLDMAATDTDSFTERLSRSLSMASEASTEFAFDDCSDDQTLLADRSDVGGAEEDLCRRYPAKMRFKRIIAGYKRLGEMLGVGWHGPAHQSQRARETDIILRRA